MGCNMRTLSAIASEIAQDWRKPYFGAVPYLQAMSTLTDMSQSYGYDDAENIVRYFLSNATSWRGDTARRIKAELKGMLR
jgi:hypothetical protein